MTIENKLDKILDILYDDKELLWKQISTTDIVIFGKRKYDIDWEDADISFIMTMLINDGYVVMNKGDFTGSNMKMPTYSLTTKGIQLKHKGGFTKTKRVEDFKNFLILWGSIIAIVVSVMTIVDLGIKFFDMATTKNTTTTSNTIEKEPNKKNEQRKDNQTLPKSTEEINVVKSDTVSQPIKKQDIGTTK